MRRIQIQIDDRLKELDIDQHRLRPDEASLLHLPEDVQPEQEPGRDFRPVRLPGDREHGGGLLQRSGRHPRPLQAHSGPLQGLYRHSKAQRDISPSTPRSSARTACPSRCRSAPRRCTRSPSTASPPTGNTSRTARAPATEGRYEWVRRLLENQEGADAEDYIHSLKIDMFSDEVFVFTPGGDVHEPARRRHAHRLCLRHPLRRGQPHGGRQGERPDRHAGPCAEKRRHRGGPHLQERQGSQPGLDEDCQMQRGPQQDPPVVQEGEARGEHRKRPCRLRGGAEALRHLHEGRYSRRRCCRCC